MKSHTGMNMSLGRGTMYGASSKQKINTSSSTHAELVGVSDAMPKVLWCRRFLENVLLYRIFMSIKTTRVPYYSMKMV